MRLKIVKGSTYHNWTTIEYLPGTRGANPKWKCVCGCGTVREVLADSLMHERSKSCGCLQRSRVEIKVGGTYGHWTTLEYIAGKVGQHPKWRCRCVCGTEKAVSAGNLAEGKSKSCGCKSATRKHGQSGTTLHQVWRSMMSRCYNPSDRAYRNYGGRGILVHPEWHDFDAFARDVGPHPGGGLSLDRVDNENGYFPSNCRWATRTEQARNTRSTVMIEFRGKCQCLKAWADELEVDCGSLRWRRKEGMTWEETFEDVLKNPIKRKAPK